ncbi:MAG: sulfurtransferase TusA family protein [Candidatus Caldarchaeum sp.]|uniref:Sulfurtransferase TusA family protein n=1 Tax=Caldiarchaeum subterraneum TaxID=311458 RepID=A0A7C5L975_CALS0
MSSIKPALVLDARGDMCPMPVIKTNKAIQSIAVGEVLEVLATDPASKPDLEAWSRTSGNKIISYSEEGESPKVYRFLIQRMR